MRDDPELLQLKITGLPTRSHILYISAHESLHGNLAKIKISINFHAWHGIRRVGRSTTINLVADTSCPNEGSRDADLRVQIRCHNFAHQKTLTTAFSVERERQCVLLGRHLQVN